MSVALFHSPYGDFHLAPYPARHREQLRAWCAADLLLLEQCVNLHLHDSRLLVVNDTHGALCCALEPVAHWTDSTLAQRATQRNQQRNGRTPTPTTWSIEAPAAADAVVMRIPKQLDYFEYQLGMLSRILPEGALLIAAGMDKHLSPHSANLIERHYGETQRHRGQKKARVFCARNARRSGADQQSMTKLRYVCDRLDNTLVSWPNVFSAGSLDQGSRLLIDSLSGIEPAQTCIDLACGNGVLGLVAFKRQLAGSIVFCDESAMAIASAQENATALFGDSRNAFEFLHTDGLATVKRSSGQLVLCNPPFHRGHTVDDYAGRRLLRQCAQHLSPGGRLLMVCNNHLPYLPLLRKHFSRATRLGGDRRYDILLAEQA